MPATDTCPGCARKFAPGGFSNHLQLSRDTRCASAWDRLRPTYPSTPNQEPPQSSTTIDVEMVDLSDTESVTPGPSQQPDQTNMDTDPSNHGTSYDNDEDPQSAFEEGPDHFARLLNARASVIFESDAEDSDDDGDQDRTRPGPETPSSTTDANAEQVSQTGGSIHSIYNSSPNLDLSDHQSRSRQFQSNPDPVRFVVKFPGAGEALETQPSLGGHQRYANSLDTEGSGPTEWAPFSTRREWEMARWAKLRGPSSTALTELLEIDGVSRSTLIRSNGAKQHLLSFPKRLDCHLRVRRNSTRSSTRNSKRTTTICSGGS